MAKIETFALLEALEKERKIVRCITHLERLGGHDDGVRRLKNDLDDTRDELRDYFKYVLVKKEETNE